jgi:hypothetical protein
MAERCDTGFLDMMAQHSLLNMARESGGKLNTPQQPAALGPFDFWPG